ncbi:hypothetical protein [Acidovorax sp.]|uniref:hypothetical protein n=1 Tax=Acidovorax sp. TaxID=1872122 RepID=UPI00391EEB41
MEVEPTEAARFDASLPTCEELLQSCGTSFWLKGALQSALSRDPCDAAADADMLAAVLRKRMQRIQGRD